MVILIVLSLNAYYVAFAKSFYGIVVNSGTIILIQILTVEFIKKTFTGGIYES